ncbi:hypothetical protein AOX55_00006262 (plasmid) [Sinorhizobium fredii CCBAU 25509]|nr:hypothetical protein AOX55_00006262 [Sinorhizobium fredii CCBAU 25509]
MSAPNIPAPQGTLAKMQKSTIRKPKSRRRYVSNRCDAPRIAAMPTGLCRRSNHACATLFSCSL